MGFCTINDIRVVLGGSLEEQTNERFFVYHDNCRCLIFDLVFSLKFADLND